MIVLLTGATGLIGAEVAARLAAKGAGVIGLVHSNPRLARNNGREIPTVPWNGAPRSGTVTTLTGDVTQPRFGLDRGQYDAVREAADLVVHGAAITDFGRAQPVYDSVNVNGTYHALGLVRPRGARPIPLVHVSTAYVCGEHEGTFREEDLDTGQSFGTAYEQSKFRAETMVREAQAGGLPAAVVRPSIVVGAERSGVVREFQNMYVVLKALTEGRVRSIPGYYDARLDLVPVDYVAEVVVEATLRFSAAEGRTFHALGARPHTLRDFSDVLAEYPTFHVPRYIPPSSFMLDKLPLAERIYYERIVGLYETYFRRRVIHTNVNAAKLLGRKPSAQGLPYLRRLLDYALKVGYLGAPLPSVEEALAGMTREGR